MFAEAQLPHKLGDFGALSAEPSGIRMINPDALVEIQLIR
jgi:hypothetical protein